MYLIITFFTSILILYTIFVISEKFKFLLDEPSENIRKIHNKVVVKIGGMSMLSFYISLIFLHDPILIQIIIFGLIFMLIGLIADINQKFSGKLRFILMIVILLFFLIKNNFIVDNFDHEILNYIFNSYHFMPFIFVLMGLMFCINGFNFIDGNDGLMTGVAAIILLNFLIYIDETNIEILILIKTLLTGIIVLFVVNFVTGKILAGDCGAYFIGFIIGALSIYIANNDMMFATLIACIICYPINDLFISFWRRLLINKKNPLEPDDRHLHSILYRILKFTHENNLKKKNIIFVNPNSGASLLILLYLTLISSLTYFYGDTIGYLNTFFIISSLQLTLYLIISDLENRIIQDK